MEELNERMMNENEDLRYVVGCIRDYLKGNDAYEVRRHVYYCTKPLSDYYEEVIEGVAVLMRRASASTAKIVKESIS